MTDSKLPYLLFHPKFICKFGNSRKDYGQWDFQETRKTFEKEYWKVGCFAIDAELRRFELLEVRSKGPARIWDNLFQPKEKVFLKIEHVFEDRFEQLTFDQARMTFVDAVYKGKWWAASGETEAQFRDRNARYVAWSDLIEPVSLKGRYP